MGTVVVVLAATVLLEAVIIGWLFHRCGVVTERWEEGLKDLRLASDHIDEQDREMADLRQRLLDKGDAHD